MPTESLLAGVNGEGRHVVEREQGLGQPPPIPSARERSLPAWVWDALTLEEAVDVRIAWNTLPLKDRELLWLAYVEGQDRAEIAKLLGIGYEAARQRISRAIGRLRLALGTGYDRSETEEIR